MSSGESFPRENERRDEPAAAKRRDDHLSSDGSYDAEMLGVVYECPDCHALQPEPGRCGRCPGTVSPQERLMASIAVSELAELQSEIKQLRAAAEKVADAYTAEAEDWNDGEFALWRKDDLVNAIVKLRQVLNGRSR